MFIQHCLFWVQCLGVLVCIFPGRSIQIVVAIVLSFIFLQVYMSASPFISDHLGKSKIIAQTQILVIFFMAYLVKENISDILDGWVVSALFAIVIFFNLGYDVFCVFGTSLEAPNRPGVKIIELRVSPLH